MSIEVKGLLLGITVSLGLLGVTSVNYVEGHNTLAVVDSPLAS